MKDAGEPAKVKREVIATLFATQASSPVLGPALIGPFPAPASCPSKLTTSAASTAGRKHCQHRWQQPALLGNFEWLLRHCCHGRRARLLNFAACQAPPAGDAQAGAALLFFSMIFCAATYLHQSDT